MSGQDNNRQRLMGELMQTGMSQAEASARVFGEPGGKEQAGKVEVYTGFIHTFPRAITAVAKCTMEGAAAPGHYLHGWKLVPNGFKVYSEALVRHQLAEALSHGGGEGLKEAIAVAWNAMARLEHLLMRGIDAEREA